MTHTRPFLGHTLVVPLLLMRLPTLLALKGLCGFDLHCLNRQASQLSQQVGCCLGSPLRTPLIKQNGDVGVLRASQGQAAQFLC